MWNNWSLINRPTVQFYLRNHFLAINGDDRFSGMKFACNSISSLMISQCRISALKPEREVEGKTYCSRFHSLMFPPHCFDSCMLYDWCALSRLHNALMSNSWLGGAPNTSAWKCCASCNGQLKTFPAPTMSQHMAKKLKLAFTGFVALRAAP